MPKIGSSQEKAEEKAAKERGVYFVLAIGILLAGSLYYAQHPTKTPQSKFAKNALSLLKTQSSQQLPAPPHYASLTQEEAAPAASRPEHPATPAPENKEHQL
ncbi:MAG: hypothetical protein AB7E52_07420 [Bdellovibrionales bacterium]